MTKLRLNKKTSKFDCVVLVSARAPIQVSIYNLQSHKCNSTDNEFEHQSASHDNFESKASNNSPFISTSGSFIISQKN